MWRIVCCLTLASSLASPAAGAFAPRDAMLELSRKELLEAEGQRLSLPVEWRYHPGDDPAFAAPAFDDSAWSAADTRLRGEEMPAHWDGVGWFRLRLRVAPDLRGVPLGLTLRQHGAAEVYLDGDLLFAVGTVDPLAARARPRVQRRPHLFVFDGRGEHQLAVRFCNHDPGAFERAGEIGGFEVELGEANQRLAAFSESLRSLAAHQALFTGVIAAFALLHLLFFAFYPEAKENLYFALLAGVVALIVYLFLEIELTAEPLLFRLYDPVMNTAWPLLCAFALRFVYSVFYERPPKLLYLALAAVAALVAAGWLWPAAAKPWVFLLLVVVSVEMLRTVAVALYRRKPGAQIVGFGILALVGGITIGLLANLGALAPSGVTSFLIPFSSVLVLILTMSVYLSRQFARTSRELRRKLRQVEELSEQQLEQERLAREAEVERRLLEAENERQARELEEARKLQLSMLPESLPKLPGLEVAAGMYTATEVGGDYYDFDVGEDGTLTIAIGDATGHGMRAGTLVTATKSLFNAMDDATDLTGTLDRFGHALKRMNLHQLRMSLTLARFKDGKLQLAAAGMPPALVHRAASGMVESVEAPGMPLGGFAGYGYRQSELQLDPGDTLLLMSDGYPERRNGEDEMLGYDKALEVFSKAAASAPQAVIDHLVAEGEVWAEGKPADDDITFVVLKRQAANQVVRA